MRAEKSHDEKILRPASNPFSADGGLKLLRGNLGRSVIKTSAVDPKYWEITAPARVFESQEALAAALKAGIDGDFIAVVRGQGPRANGMPELHKLIPAMSGLLAKGRRVAIVTDGRMSGASGKVPSAIHLTPEAAADGPISRLRDGDIIRLDARAGVLEAQVDAATLQAREIGQARSVGRHVRRRPRVVHAPARRRDARRTRARRFCESCRSRGRDIAQVVPRLTSGSEQPRHQNLVHVVRLIRALVRGTQPAFLLEA